MFDIELAVDSDAVLGKPKPPARSLGTVKVDGTLEAVIDGSSRDSTMKTVIKTNIGGKDKSGLKASGDVVEEKTVKSLK